jgi:hypothetical protein
MGKIINNPALNEFIYTLLYQSTMEERRGLKGKYLKIAMSAKAAKIFATTSTREEKEYIMSHFGFEFGYVIFKRGMAMTKFKHILDKFEKKKQAAALADIAEEGLFVMADKEFIRLLGLTSQAIHHPAYFLNLELNRQGYHIQKWSRKFDNQEDMATREVDMNAKLVVRTCLNANMTMDYWPGTTGISVLQMKILLYLYSVSHLYVGEGKLFDIFIGVAAKFKFNNAIKGLIDNTFIMKNVSAKEKEYSITGLGIKQVNEFVTRTVNLNTF